MTQSRRDDVADFWDAALADWIAGQPVTDPDLKRWQAGYSGTGKGSVDLGQYPDPYVGDLRGVETEPRLVVLGLNPGIGYEKLQGRDGIWTRRIAERGYSRTFDRSPEGDPESWLATHGKRSPYWVKMAYFAQRWLDDPAATPAHILNFELFPWHSPAKTAHMQIPPDLIHRYVWGPIQEVNVTEVFAFGADWFAICQQLGLERIAMFGHGGEPISGLEENRAKWRLGVYRLPSGQRVVASAQSGNSTPPGPSRLAIMRELVASATA